MVDDGAQLTTSDVVHLVFKEAGQLVSKDAVIRWRRAGLLPAAERTVGGVFLFRARDVRKFLDRRRKERELRASGSVGSELEPPDAG